jgi:DNA-binding CsgD family transcriptional regulator
MSGRNARFGEDTGVTLRSLEVRSGRVAPRPASSPRPDRMQLRLPCVVPDPVVVADGAGHRAPRTTSVSPDHRIGTAGRSPAASDTQRGLRVVIQDRSRLFREGLELLLASSSAIQVFRCVGDVASLIEACGPGAGEAVVFEGGGVPWDVGELVDCLRARLGNLVLIGTLPPGHASPKMIEGVTYLPRGSSCQTLMRVLGGESAGPGLSAPRPDLGGEETGSLTQRELQVLALISAGLTTAQIAIRIGISPKTVENRRQSLFAKLGVQNQSHAIAVAMRTGVLGSAPGARGRS